ncbi:acyltransferase family protein [Actinophytocola sp.]|uniref:acyltransferase family protein n=1 Tax=Actinophytocola sp. TaxID=1872138 RepID=UPI003D6A3CA0
MATAFQKVHANPQVAFAWLRLLSALLVVLDHSVFLPDPTRSATVLNISVGDYALLVFFALSGYQIQDSWERDPSWWRFSARRVLRIVPPLAVVLVVTAFVIGPLFTTLATGEYLTDGQTWAYLSMVVPFFLRGPLPGVFESNPHDLSVNPSLWTLPMEVFGYGLALVLGIAIAIGLPRFVLPAALGGLMLTQGVLDVTLSEFDPGGFLGVMPIALLVKFMIAFLAGATLHAYRDKLAFRPRYALALAAAWLVIHEVFMPDAAAPPGGAAGTDGSVFRLVTLDKWLLALGVAYGAIVLGRHWPRRLERGARWVYGSYGAYIWAAPLQQTFIALGVTSGWVLLFVSVPAAYLAGLASWHLVELPTQRLRRHLGGHRLPMAGPMTDPMTSDTAAPRREPEPARG